MLVFEDVHWAEEPLLDVIEHLARALRDSPVLIVCVARPDLLEHEAVAGAAATRARSRSSSGALSAEQSRELVDALLANSDVPPAQRALALEKAEGNPLFLEETARMLSDDEAGTLKRIPDSVQALIAARIDALDASEKRVLQHAALVGRVFWRGALDALSPNLDVGDALDRLLEREFVAPEAHSSIAGERAFRFTHGLIREVAYGTLTKAHRAEDHITLAAWVAERAPDELADIRAHHLDDAASLAARARGRRAGRARARGRRQRSTAPAAARCAAARSPSPAPLPQRAVELEPTVKRRYFARPGGRRASPTSSTAREEAQAVLEDARAEGDRRFEGRALVLLAEIALRADSDVTCATELADQALEALPEDDLHGLYDARTLLATIAWWVGDAEASRRHGEAAVELAQATDRRDLESLALTRLAGVAERTRRRRDEARELTERATELALESGSREALGWARAIDRPLRALPRATTSSPRPASAKGSPIFEETGAAGRAGWAKAMLGSLELRRGNLARAEDLLRDADPPAARDEGARVPRRGRAHAGRDARRAGRSWPRPSASPSTPGRRSAARTSGRGPRPSTRSGSCAPRRAGHDEAEALLREALAILEPTMYRRFADEVRASLETVAATRAAARPS